MKRSLLRKQSQTLGFSLLLFAIACGDAAAIDYFDSGGSKAGSLPTEGGNGSTTGGAATAGAGNVSVSGGSSAVSGAPTVGMGGSEGGGPSAGSAGEAAEPEGEAGSGDISGSAGSAADAGSSSGAQAGEPDEADPTGTGGDVSSGGSDASAGVPSIDGDAGEDSQAGTAGQGGSDSEPEPEHTTVIVELEREQDCEETECPEEAPYIVGCDLSFNVAISGEQKACVHLNDDQTVIFIGSGDTCGRSHLIEGTITCSSEPLSGGLTQQLCPSENRSATSYVEDRCDCALAEDLEDC